LEIYSYNYMEDKVPAVANRKGLGHLVFGVDNVTAKLEEAVSCGGRAVGETITTEVPGAGQLTCCYVADPERNLIELQAWS
jgi:predicted enzyme related to lactoylglutathione lyase